VAQRGGRPAASFKDFSEQLSQAVMESLGIEDPESELGKEVSRVLSHEMLPLNRFSDFKPWDIPSGGTDAPSVALYGNDMAKQNMVADDISTSPAERSTRILTSFMKSFGKAPGGMVGLGVNGLHAFNGLPNHPSLQTLKSDDEGGISEPALKRRVETELIEKGRALSQTDLAPERAAWLFGQCLDAVIAQERDPALLLMLSDIAKARRPRKAMKPAALTTAVTGALQPYFDTANAGKRPASSAGSVTSAMKNALVRELRAPEFVLADSNWGDSTYQILFVVAPDPTTGEATMWRKTEPPGTLSPLDTDWLGKAIPGGTLRLMIALAPVPVLGLAADGKPVVMFEGGRQTGDLAGMFALAPLLWSVEQATELARAANHLAHGTDYRLIEDPAAFERAYRARVEREDPNAEWR